MKQTKSLLKEMFLWSMKTDARANAQRLSRSAAVACFRCLLGRLKEQRMNQGRIGRKGSRVLKLL